MYTLKELKTLKKQELKQELVAHQKELLETKLQVRIGQSKTHHKIGDIKKYIARILTLLYIKEKTGPENVKKEDTKKKEPKKKEAAAKE